MAEVPPHLLERSRARRGALAGGGSDAPAPAPVAAATPARTEAPGAVAAASSAAAAPPKGPLVPDLPVAAPPPPRAPRIPAFALPVLLLLPVWALFYAGNWIKDVGNVLTPEQEGAKLFTANCAACHNANGSGSEGGGVGRPLWNGQAEKTFKTAAEQIAFVRLGSDKCKGKGYGDSGREGGQHVAKGGMPGGWEAMTDQQLGYVIAYERNNLSGKAFPTTTVAPGVTPTTIKVDASTVCPA